MTTPSELRALADRVEKAAESSVDLDADIAVAITPGLFRDNTHVGFTGAGDMRLPPPYTASLDAAVTLVPEGWRWSVDTLLKTGPLALCDPERGTWVRSDKAATPALALTAAALRAIAAEKEGE